MENRGESSSSRKSVPTDKNPNLLQRAGKHVQVKIMGGIFELLPILITVIVILFIVNYADAFIRPLPLVKDRAWDFPGIGIIVCSVTFYIVGLFVSNRFGKNAMDFFKDDVLTRIPVVKGVFGVTLQATSAITAQYNFSRVVFLEWPREGMIAMGFVTARIEAPNREHSLAMVYIPTIPNPTSGNMAVVIEDDLMETDLTVEGAMKLIFSGGIVPPDTISFARLPGEPRKPGDFIGSFHSDR